MAALVLRENIPLQKFKGLGSSLIQVSMVDQLRVLLQWRWPTCGTGALRLPLVILPFLVNRPSKSIYLCI